MKVPAALTTAVPKPTCRLDTAADATQCLLAALAALDQANDKLRKIAGIGAETP